MKCPLVRWMSNRTVTHPGWVLLHLMLVAMRATGITPPEAVLAELVTPATEAAIAETCHPVATTVGAGDGVIDWQRGGKHNQSTWVDQEQTEPIRTGKIQNWDGFFFFFSTSASRNEERLSAGYSAISCWETLDPALHEDANWPWMLSPTDTSMLTKLHWTCLKYCYQWSAVGIKGFNLSETMFGWVWWVKNILVKAASQSFPLEHCTAATSNVIHSVGLWF